MKIRFIYQLCAKNCKTNLNYSSKKKAKEELERYTADEMKLNDMFHTKNIKNLYIVKRILL